MVLNETVRRAGARARAGAHQRLHARDNSSAVVPAVGAAAVLALALALVAPTAVAAQDVGLPVGAQAAQVMVEDLDGNAVPVASSLGAKPVLLEFWAAWCSVCAELEPEMHRVHEEFGDDVEIVIVAVGVNQNPRTIRRHIARSPVAGRLVFDRRGAATRAFMAPATSYVVLLDAKGRVAYTGQGGDQELTAEITRLLAAR